MPQGTINFSDSWANEHVNSLLNDMKGRTLNYYAENARTSTSSTSYKFDLKNLALQQFGSIYYGSLLYDDVSASARDAGNFAAGLIQNRSIVPNMITTLGFGVYQQKGVNKEVLFGPYYGEEKQSGIAQQLGRAYSLPGYLPIYEK